MVHSYKYIIIAFLILFISPMAFSPDISSILSSARKYRTDKNIEKSKYFYFEAAKLNSSEAFNALGEIYFV